MIIYDIRVFIEIVSLAKTTGKYAFKTALVAFSLPSLTLDTNPLPPISLNQPPPPYQPSPLPTSSLTVES